ncbi:MAG: hypothetical protein WCP89_02125, partial [archaeon]
DIVHLVLSDTDETKKEEPFLKKYFENKGFEVKSTVIEGLKYKESQFKLTGLRSLINTLINNDGGLLAQNDFSFSVNGASDVAFEVDGTNDLIVNAGTYTITEPAVLGYGTTYSTCSSLAVPSGGSATCTITNDDIAPTPIPTPAPTHSGGSGVTYGCKDPSAMNYNAYSSSKPDLCRYANDSSSTALSVPEEFIIPLAIPTVATFMSSPGLPDTGFPPLGNNLVLKIFIVAIILFSITSIIFFIKNRKMGNKKL